jgi:hypothetical protein
LNRHNKPAFDAFLVAARGDAPGSRDWKVRGQQMTVDGANLIWGAVTPARREAVIDETSLHDTIGLDRIIAECADWRPDAYYRIVTERRR